MKWLREILRAAFPETTPELDLHGLRVREALEAVERSLREAETSGLPRLRVVCGKGRHSPGGTGVLREAVAGWLEAHGYSGRYRRDMERDGRDGALWVELKQPRRGEEPEG